MPPALRRGEVAARHFGLADLADRITRGSYAVPAELVADAILAEATALRRLRLGVDEA